MKNFRLKGSLSGWGTYPYMFPDRTSSPAFGRPACWTDKNGLPISQAHQGSNPLGAPCGLGLAAARARARFVRVRALGVRPKEANVSIRSAMLRFYNRWPSLIFYAGLFRQRCGFTCSECFFTVPLACVV